MVRLLIVAAAYRRGAPEHDADVHQHQRHHLVAAQDQAFGMNALQVLGPHPIHEGFMVHCYAECRLVARVRHSEQTARLLGENLRSHLRAEPCDDHEVDFRHRLYLGADHQFGS